MAGSRLDQDILKKLAKRTGKGKKYVREQISKRAARLGIASSAAEILRARDRSRRPTTREVYWWRVRDSEAPPFPQVFAAHDVARGCMGRQLTQHRRNTNRVEHHVRPSRRMAPSPPPRVAPQQARGTSRARATTRDSFLGKLLRSHRGTTHWASQGANPYFSRTWSRIISAEYAFVPRGGGSLTSCMTSSARCLVTTTGGLVVAAKE
jgi:hypothetical protein